MTVICWRYLALPFLPVNEVHGQLRRIKRFIQACQERAIRKLLRTFHNDYIVGYWCKKITPQLWCSFGSLHKTNNCCESLHKKMKANLQCHAGDCLFNHFTRLLASKCINHLMQWVFDHKCSLFLYLFQDSIPTLNVWLTSSSNLKQGLLSRSMPDMRFLQSTQRKEESWRSELY